MKKVGFVLGLTLLFWSCNNSVSKLTYSNKEVFVKDDTCKTESCTNATIRYLEFKGTAADTLNKITLELVGASYFNDSFVIYTPEKTAKEFISVYHSAQEEFPESGITWMLDKQVSVDTVFKNMVTIRYDEASFTGGAHGNYFTQFNHYCLKPFKLLWLADFLNEPADTFQVIKIAEAVFRESEQLSAYDNLTDEGFFFEDGIFRLNDNFHFTKEGVVFHFNIYEIQPYAKGPYDLLVPYKKLEHLLNMKLLKGAN